jgi:hypothetical protein
MPRTPMVVQAFGAQPVRIRDHEEYRRNLRQFTLPSDRLLSIGPS